MIDSTAIFNDQTANAVVDSEKLTDKMLGGTVVVLQNHPAWITNMLAFHIDSRIRHLMYNEVVQMLY